MDTTVRHHKNKNKTPYISISTSYVNVQYIFNKTITTDTRKKKTHTKTKHVNDRSALEWINKFRHCTLLVQNLNQTFQVIHNMQMTNGYVSKHLSQLSSKGHFFPSFLLGNAKHAYFHFLDKCDKKWLKNTQKQIKFAVEKSESVDNVKYFTLGTDDHLTLFDCKVKKWYFVYSYTMLFENHLPITFAPGNWKENHIYPQMIQA